MCCQKHIENTFYWSISMIYFHDCNLQQYEFKCNIALECIYRKHLINLLIYWGGQTKLFFNLKANAVWARPVILVWPKWTLKVLTKPHKVPFSWASGTLVFFIITEYNIEEFLDDVLSYVSHLYMNKRLLKLGNFKKPAIPKTKE